MKTKRKNPGAVAMGRIKTPRKALSSARNGCLGGRPRKNLPDLPHECGGTFRWARTRGKAATCACDGCKKIQTLQEGWKQYEEANQ